MSTTITAPSSLTSKLTANATHNLPPCKLQHKIYWYIVNKLACPPGATSKYPHLDELIEREVEISCTSESESMKIVSYTLTILEEVGEVEKINGAGQAIFLRAFKLTKKLCNQSEDVKADNICDTLRARSPPTTIASNGHSPENFTGGQPNYQQYNDGKNYGGNDPFNLIYWCPWQVQCKTSTSQTLPDGRNVLRYVTYTQNYMQVTVYPFYPNPAYYGYSATIAGC